MRFILIVIIFLIGWARATTPAYYLHHERSTQAAVEADCQNRELCLDRTNLAPLGRFNDGTLWHGVTQEKPNVNLTGTLTVTGTTVLSNNLTMSILGINLPVFTNGSKQLTTNPVTGTGNVVMSASPTITGTIAGASETLSGTLGVTGASTFTGNISIGAFAPLANEALYINTSALTGGSQYLIDASGTFGSAATTATTIYAQVNAPASAAIINDYAIRIASTTKVSGTITTNYGLKIEDQTVGSTNYALYTGLGAVVLGGATTLAGGLTSSAGGGYEEGSFTGSSTGFTTVLTPTIYYVRIGKLVTLNTSSFTGTSNANFFTITGLPVSLKPLKPYTQNIPVYDNGTTIQGGINIATDGVIYFGVGLTTNTAIFTTSGFKGLPISGYTFTYTLQ